MTPNERMLFERLDRMILDASKDELKKIQKKDMQTQLDGLPFYDSNTGSIRPARVGHRSHKH